jgi:hypothetical protein
MATSTAPALLQQADDLLDDTNVDLFDLSPSDITTGSTTFVEPEASAAAHSSNFSFHCVRAETALK